MMSNDKKRHSNEGIGRILKNSLADSTRSKRDSSHRHNTDYIPTNNNVINDDNNDDLNNPLILQALQNIGSRYHSTVDDQSLVKDTEAEKDAILQQSDSRTVKKTEVCKQSQESNNDNGNHEECDISKKEIHSSSGHIINNMDHRKEMHKDAGQRHHHGKGTSHFRISDSFLSRNGEYTIKGDVAKKELEDKLPPRLRNKRSQLGLDLNKLNCRFHSGERFTSHEGRYDKQEHMSSTDRKRNGVSKKNDRHHSKETKGQNNGCLQEEENWAVISNPLDSLEIKSRLSGDELEKDDKKSCKANNDICHLVKDNAQRDCENKRREDRESFIKGDKDFVDNEKDSHDEHHNNFQSESFKTAMDKIQSLFVSYTSPIVSQNEKRAKGILKTPQQVINSDVYSGNFDCTEQSIRHSNNTRGVLIESKDSIVTFGALKDRTPSDSFDRSDTQDEMCRDVVVTRPNDSDCQDKSNKELNEGLEDLRINENDYEGNWNRKFFDTCQAIREEEQSPSPSRAKYHQSSKYFMKSPASIPSGFSSDYDVGIVSQDEDDESPFPLATNLFPSDDETDRDEQQPLPARSLHGYNGNQSVPHQMPPHHPWYHPAHYPNHYYRFPFMSHQQSYPSPYYGCDPSYSSHYNPYSTQSQSTTLTVPAETFSEKDSINRVQEFVKDKVKDWNAFTSHRHGHTVPVDAVISVALSGARDSQASKEDSLHNKPTNTQSTYPDSGLQYPSNSANMRYHTWQNHPYPHTHSEETPLSHYDRYCTENVGQNSSCREETEKCVEEKKVIEEAMKRRLISSEDVHNEVNDGTCDRDNKKSKQSHDGKEDGLSRHGDHHEKSHPVSDKKLNRRSLNSVSNFLNPNDLSNNWTLEKQSSSSATGHAKYGFDSSNKYSKERKRDRSPYSKSSSSHGYLNKKDHQPYISDAEQDKVYNSQKYVQPNGNKQSSLDKSFDESSSHLKDKKSSLNESPSTENWNKQVTAADFTPPKYGKFSSDNTQSSSEYLVTSPESSSSSQEMSNSYHRRRSDSFVSYHSADRSPLAINRMCKTPGAKRTSFQGDTWKVSLKNRSRTYNHRFIDTHCHIDFMYYRTGTATIPFKQYVDRHADSFPANYEGCVAIFCNPKVFSSTTQAYDILQLLAKEDRVWIAVGCHPKNAMDFRTSHLLRLRVILTEHPKTVALGEIGLDYSGTFHQHADVQKTVFISQLELALELDLPLVIHCRDADKDCLEIMKKTVPAEHKIHLHCFTRHISIARQWMEHFPNLFVGFTPVITYATAKDATQAAELIPLDRLLLETDAPYFVPDGVNITEVRKVSHPGFALYTAERIADIKGISVDDVLEACRKNTRTMYGI